MHLPTLRALALLPAAAVVTALGQERIISISTNSSASAFQIAGGPVASGGQILVSDDDHWGVIRAAGDLAQDFGRVTGVNYTLSCGKAGAKPARYEFTGVNNLNNTHFTTLAPSFFAGPTYADPAPAKVVIIAGTIGKSTVIDALVAAGKLDVSATQGKWEAFTSQVVDDPVPGTARALVIAGSDARGTIFGIYDVSEQIGVSPWYFWTDTPPKVSKEHWVVVGKKVQGSPSVRYRGFFLNDEQPALTGWVSERFPDTAYGPGYGPEFYRLIFEVLLRLRANYIWPALWASMFEVDDPGNQPLADAYEIVLGTSHTEPLMRAQNEFGKFYKGPWAYNLNNETIDDYFRYGIQRAKPYARNSLWTVGMRGTGDTAIEGLGVEHIVEMLQTLVKNQRDLIAEGLGGVDITKVPQAWCLYKEVMSYLFHGLEVPDDVTLLWADDNWGNVRRLPTAAERGRAGGAGVYYHFDYVGDVRDYKWINTIQLSKTAEQMHMAYARGADRIWIVNVGDMKALELPINHFFDLAYDTKRWHVDSTDEWTRLWATREFAPAYAAEISNVVQRYSMYASRRKFELVEPHVYSLINYNEAEAVLEQWGNLVADAQAIYDKLPAALQATFFQTVLQPSMAGEILTRIQVGGARNNLYAGQKRNSANDVISDVLALSQQDANLTMRWDALLGGKWKHFMDQTHLGYDGYWQQPMRNSLPAMIHVQTNFPSLAGHVGVGVEGSNATIGGDDKYHSNSGNTLAVPPLDPYGPSARYFDVFTRGTKECEWEAVPWQPWVKVSPSKGTVGAKGSDTRVLVSIDWANAPPAPYASTININVTTPCRGIDRYSFKAPMVQVPVVNRVVPSSFSTGFVESDGVVAITGAHYQAIKAPAQSGGANVSYHTFANYGRTGSGVGLVPQGAEKLSVDTAPALEYSVYLFTNHSAANVSLYLSPVLNFLGEDVPVEYAIALFPAGEAQPKPTVVRPVGPTVGGNMPDGWGGAVADSVWGRQGSFTRSSFKVAREGAYTLRIWALMPGIIVQKVVVDLGGVRPSFFGPPESFLVGRDKKGAFDSTSFVDEVGTLGGRKK